MEWKLGKGDTAEQERRDVAAKVVEVRRAAGCGARVPARPPPRSLSAARAPPAHPAALLLCAWQACSPLCSRTNTTDGHKKNMTSQYKQKDQNRSNKICLGMSKCWRRSWAIH
ncbi:hypothetical protein O3G_MSEX008416 [Manduca sexta]|uniref:Uncharacterized protein n=1 Tax=Manduca sexta TaxID=7130 RepID=A0A922CQC0_MANSE|nr:hypothetical protein O3G_MSEX008416 [Manduca sexta]